MLDSPGRRLSRRHFLGSAAISTAAFRTSETLMARRGLTGHQAVHRSGNLEVLVVSDGHFLLPTEFLLTPDSPPSDRDTVLSATPLVGEQLRLPNNVAVIRRGSDLILVDAGAGPRHQPTSGKLADNLRAVGIQPADVTTVVLTHAHPDHLWGLLDTGDNPIYPNASYRMSAREREVWSDPNVLQTLPPALANERIVSGAKSHLARIKDKIEVARGGDEIVPGVRVLETPGHTPGHLSLELADGDGLVIGADALTHVVISFQYPSWRVPVDHDAERGISTRLRLLDRLATDKLRLLGAHLPAPGTGFVERRGRAYRFVPA